MTPSWKIQKQRLLQRLRRVEGQLRGVQALIERETDCELVAQQLAAARKALDRSFFDLMSCVTQRELTAAGVTGATARKRLQHVAELLEKYG